MLSHPGPWITDPPVSYTLSFAWLGDSNSQVPWGQWRGVGTNFAAICDAGSPGGLTQVMALASVAGFIAGGETDYDGNPIARGALMGYQQEGMRLSFPIDAFDALPAINGLALPAPAVDFQVEGHLQGEVVPGDLAWITSDVAIVGDHWTVNPTELQFDIDHPAGYETGHPLAGVVEYRANPTPHDTSTSWATLSTFETSANLGAFTLLGSDTFAGGTYDTMYSPAVTAPRTLLPSSGALGRLEIIVDAKAVVDKTAPTYGALNGDNPGYDEDWYFIVRPGIISGSSWPPTISDPAGGTPPGCTYSVTFTYQRPRYRYFYPLAPRLRQFPRDDSLGGAPRQDRASRSVQGSARQSWTGAYR